MEIAVLGGEFQGCCVAIALAERGARAYRFFDRSAALMTRAAAANEGKIHLSYVYTGDRPMHDPHVVNALWDGRLAIDGGRGLQPAWQWMCRFKYGGASRGLRVRPIRMMT
jgi:hypothetical protein